MPAWSSAAIAPPPPRSNDAVNALADLPDPLPVQPVAGPLDVVVHLPGSKSITNRALVCAALAGGVSTLAGALVADDTRAMIGVLASLGVHCVPDGQSGG